MSMTLKSFSVRAAGRKSPGAVMAEVNKDLAKDIHRGKFVSAFYAVLDECTLADVAHNQRALAKVLSLLPGS